MERAFDMCLDLFDRSVLIMGPLLLIGGCVLVNLVAYVYFSTPFVSPLSHSLFVVVLVDALGIWLWFNVLFNWIMCWKTPPGHPPKNWEGNSREEIETCQKCDGFKPARAHHCHVCKSCVLAMDHHCPWMANCIGFYNYRYFVLTLVYLVLGCAFCVIVAAVEFRIPMKILAGTTTSVPKYVFFVFFLCSCAGTAVLILLMWHIYLIFSGQTTIEFYQRRMTPTSLRRKSYSRSWFSFSVFLPPLQSNDFDLGATQNWIRVFGESKYPFAWAMPSFQPPEGDGISWKSCRSLVSLV